MPDSHAGGFAVVDSLLRRGPEGEGGRGRREREREREKEGGREGGRAQQQNVDVEKSGTDNSWTCTGTYRAQDMLVLDSTDVVALDSTNVVVLDSTELKTGVYRVRGMHILKYKRNITQEYNSHRYRDRH